MGKSTQVDGDNNNPTSLESDPTKLLEAALLQMDGIIAGEYSANWFIYYNVVNFLICNEVKAFGSCLNSSYFMVY